MLIQCRRVRPKTLVVEALIVAGGGAGTGYGGGGGGGGGLLYRNLTLADLNNITVGAGGLANASHTAQCQPGQNSSIGSLVALGGGVTNFHSSGGAGGSGSGGMYFAGGSAYPGGTGTAGQGNTGGAGHGVEQSYVIGGGGGGAGGIGQNGTSTAGGTGGAGLSYDISGAMVHYAAGGGGGSYDSGSGGAAGGVGAGAGAAYGYPGGNAIANTGCGGGGGGFNTAAGVGGHGGSGIVIIRYAGGQKALGGTITSAGGYTIHKFTSSGTFQVMNYAASLLLDAGDTTSYPGTGTNWYDISGNGRVITNSANLVYSAGSFQYNPVAYSRIGVGTGLNQFAADFTVAMWCMRVTGGPPYGNLIGDYYTNSLHTVGEWQILLHSSMSVTVYRDGSGSLLSGVNTNASIDQWVHLVLTRRSGVVELYANGVLKASVANAEIWGTASGNLMLGVDGDQVAEPLSGKIAHVTICKDYGYTPAEVSARFNDLRSRFGI